MRRLAHLLMLVPVALLAAGCGGDGAATTTAAAVSAGQLDGRTFVATGAIGHTLAAGAEVSVTFADGRIAVATGCNTLAGAYRLHGDTLRAGELAGTLMGCEDELARQEAWIADLLRGDVTLSLGGDHLTLRGGSAGLTLTEGRPAGTPPPIVGTTWILDGFSDGAATSSVPAGVDPPTLTFTPAGEAKIFTGCNRGAGAARVGDDGFATFGPISYTRMRCGAAADAMETTVTSILTGKVALAFSGADLVTSRGGQHLTFRAG